MQLIIKSFVDKNVRCFIKNGEPYFSVLDVCLILGLSNSREQTSRLDKDDVCTTYVIDKLNRKQELTIINESALYQLIFKSRKEEAKEFQKWVTHEVLPSIRKTGKYSIPDEIKKLSTKNRNALTSEWKEHGITKPHEYIKLTLQEYKALKIEKKKPEMNKHELLMLNALESMEMLRLFENQDINGYYECKDSLIETAYKIKKVALNKLKEIKDN